MGWGGWGGRDRVIYTNNNKYPYVHSDKIFEPNLRLRRRGGRDYGEKKRKKKEYYYVINLDLSSNVFFKIFF